MRRGVRVMTALLAVLLVGLVVGAGVLWSQGYRLYAVTSGSMAPALDVGAAVVTEPADGPFAVGDVVTFPSPPGSPQALTTHRVSALAGDGLQTWGDANLAPDPAPVDAAAVVGRVVWGAPLVGYALVFFQQPAGLAAMITAALSLSLLWDLFFAPPPATDARADARARPEPRRPWPRPRRDGEHGPMVAV